jgi:hypothetical protein
MISPQLIMRNRGLAKLLFLDLQIGYFRTWEPIGSSDLSLERRYELSWAIPIPNRRLGLGPRV